MKGHSQCLEHICAPTLGTDSTVPMLHHPGTSAGCDKHRSRGNIQQACMIATGAAKFASTVSTVHTTWAGGRGERRSS